MSQPNLIIKQALNHAVQLINEGHNPTEALRKTAEAHDLNYDFTKRVGEGLNVALHHNHFKSAADTAAEFPIADIPTVVRNLYTNSTKTASQFKDDNFQEVSIHEKLPDFNKIATSRSYQEAYLTLIKSAESIQNVAPVSLSAKAVFEKSSNYIQELEKQLTNTQIKEAGHKLEVDSLFLNLAQQFNKDAGYRTSFEEFESQVFSKFGSEADQYVDILHKYAAADEPRGVHDSHYIMFDPCVECIQFSKFMKSAGELSGVVKEAQETKDHLDFEKDYIASIYKAAEDLRNGVNVKLAGVFDEVFKHIDSHLKQEHKDTHNPVKGHLDHFEHQLVLQDILIRDPILSKEDPKRVIEAYEQILRVAPQLAKEKQVVVAILRKAVASQALSPFDINQWIDAENNLSKQKITRHTGGVSSNNGGK